MFFHGTHTLETNIQDEFDIYIHNDEMHGRQKMVFVIQGGFFLLVPPQKVLSVKDDKFPTKKSESGAM